MIEGQRARTGCGSPCSDRFLDGARMGNGGMTQRFARMQYVVTGLASARIEGRPGHGPGGSMNPDLDAHVFEAPTNVGSRLSVSITEYLNEQELLRS
jgi:hypothetical protein